MEDQFTMLAFQFFDQGKRCFGGDDFLDHVLLLKNWSGCPLP
jgi:hypothetical protein